MKPTRTRNFLAACLALLLACAAICQAQAQENPADIPESAIVALQKELAEAGAEKSSVRARRACKSLVRDGESLLTASPAAPNRYRVLEIVLQCQKRLLVLENSERNRELLFDTCAKLAEAPDEVADLRLEADLLLAERDLSAKNADVKQRAQALAGLIARYRDTPGEAKSLMLASQIAPKLEAFELETQILRTMQERFADHHGVIEFRRKSLAAGRIEALFRGDFTRADGTSVSFPIDRMGHPCIVVFWSKQTQGFDVALRQINEHQQLYPDQFDTFSFNLDELPDGGEATLRALELDWTVMRLPGGRKSQTFRTYGLREPVSLLVNAYGYTLLTPTNNYGAGHDGAVNPYKINDVRITDPRYLAQLQSLFIGDFLVAEIGDPPPLAAGAVPAETLRTIQDCFTPVPFRYRLTSQQALTNYQAAAQHCAEAMAQFPQASDLWRVRDRRIIALLGMWKLGGEPQYLEQAAEESRAALAGPLPSGADVVPRFCLAKQALRGGEADAKTVLSGLIEATRGGEAPGLALAAAAILALDANSRELHHRYREILLEKHAADPALWPVVTFLRDRYHTLDLLKVKLDRGERRIRSLYGDFVGTREHLINHGIDPMTERLPAIGLKTLDGATLALPNETEGKLTLLLFVEPPADPDADFPFEIGGTRADGKKEGRPGVMQYAFEMAERHIHQEVQVIAAFLSDDAAHVRALMAKNAWPCQAALVPGGLKNPLVRQLGILSADRIPNIFLLRRDGTIAWSTSGFFYKSDFGYPFALRLAMKVHIEVCDTELAYEALAKGEFQQAARIFSGPFLPEKDERYQWAGPRFHGRALANMGLKDWGAALVDIDTAIAAHRSEFNHAKEHPCESMLSMQRLRAAVLEKLGRAEEAEAAREAAAAAPSPYPTTLYELFHGKLEKLRQQ